MDTQMTGGNGMPIVYKMQVPCPSAHALVVKNAILVDQELSPDKVTREVTIGEDMLVVEYRGATLRNTRVAVHSCLQLMALALEAVDAFHDTAALDVENLK